MAPGASQPAGGPQAALLATDESGAGARRVRDLNDRLRRTYSGGHTMMTAGVQALDVASRRELLRRVQTFDNFDAGNDPYGEHDFGRVIINAVGYFWKIDYYDAGFSHGWPDPADETVTRRVLTIMREDEY